MVCTRVRRAPSFQHLTRQRQITVSSQSQPLPANKQNDVDNWMMKTHIKNIIQFFVYVCISNFYFQSPIIYPSLKVYTFYTYCNLKDLFSIYIYFSYYPTLVSTSDLRRGSPFLLLPPLPRAALATTARSPRAVPRAAPRTVPVKRNHPTWTKMYDMLSNMTWKAYWTYCFRGGGGLSFCTEFRTISAPSLTFIMWSLLTEAGQAMQSRFSSNVCSIAGGWFKPAISDRKRSN